MTVSRVASLVLAAAYLVVAGLVVRHGAQALVACAVAALLPLPFIWFPDALGDYTGPAHLGSIGRSTPGLAVAVSAWILLLAIPPILIAVNS